MTSAASGTTPRGRSTRRRYRGTFVARGVQTDRQPLLIITGEPRPPRAGAETSGSPTSPNSLEALRWRESLVTTCPISTHTLAAVVRERPRGRSLKMAPALDYDPAADRDAGAVFPSWATARRTAPSFFTRSTIWWSLSRRRHQTVLGDPRLLIAHSFKPRRRADLANLNAPSLGAHESPQVHPSTAARKLVQAAFTPISSPPRADYARSRPPRIDAFRRRRSSLLTAVQPTIPLRSSPGRWSF